MKRTFSGWWALVSEGRAIEVRADRAVLEPLLHELAPCGDIVRCAVVVNEARIRRSRPGRAAQARRDAGGPRALGRDAVSVDEWIQSIRPQVLARDQYRCVYCGAQEFAGSRGQIALDVHHVIKTSAGGSDRDLDQLVTLCRVVSGADAGCHPWTDEAFAGHRGRLIVEPLGRGRFEIFPVVKADKWAPDPAPAGARP